MPVRRLDLEIANTPSLSLDVRPKDRTPCLPLVIEGIGVLDKPVGEPRVVPIVRRQNLAWAGAEMDVDRAASHEPPVVLANRFPFFKAEFFLKVETGCSGIGNGKDVTRFDGLGQSESLAEPPSAGPMPRPTRSGPGGVASLNPRRHSGTRARRRVYTCKRLEYPQQIVLYVY